MILCVCLSPALDITYRIDRLLVGATIRIEEVRTRPGGKAVNVAAVLHQLGEPVCVLAPVGGTVGDEFTGALGELGIRFDAVPSGRPTRRTVTLAEHDGTATLLNEPASIDCWDALVARIATRLPEAEVLVLSGSVPAGVPSDALSTLIALAHDAGRPAVVDTSGPPLADAVRARPALIKPNADELAELAGDEDPVSAARAIARTQQTIVVASLGADGVVAASTAQTWRLRPGRALTGNPTGAGDALVAGLARGLRTGADFADVLRDAVALSAAAVIVPYAGAVDDAEYARQRAGVTVETLDPVR